jgi:Rieske Fe-S protein
MAHSDRPPSSTEPPEPDPQRSSSTGADTTPADDRRDFVRKLCVGAAGAGAAAIVAVPAIRLVAYPLGTEVTRGGEGFLAVGDRARFGPTPVRVDLHADVVDAWSRTPDVKIGSCWVVEREGSLHAFSSVCPHLGCAVDFDEGTTKFKCPCHRSAFALDGAREEGPSPRGLDDLEVREEAGLVSIRFQRFKQGVPEKEPV